MKFSLSEKSGDPPSGKKRENRSSERERESENL